MIPQLRSNKSVEAEGFTGSEREWCMSKPDLPGYKSLHHTHSCLDTIGRGARTDYCRIVERYDNDNLVDKFLACDLASKGGFSYWFRSPTENEGLPIMELPYAKKLTEGAFDSYCGVIPPTTSHPARADCLSIGGLGFGSGTLPDPNPPERVRVRLRTYENLLFWLPLVGNQGTGQNLTDVIKKLPVRLEPNSPITDGIHTSGGTPYLNVLSPAPINETNAFSIMVKPNKAVLSGSDEMILFIGDDANMNEISIQSTITNKVRFTIYEGKSEVFNMASGTLVPGEWNHILIQYNNGYWYMFVNGGGVGKELGPRHSFMKRKMFMIGRTLPQHPLQGFVGKIADVRLYSRSMNKVGIDAISSDFKTSLLESKVA